MRLLLPLAARAGLGRDLGLVSALSSLAVRQTRVESGLASFGLASVFSSLWKGGWQLHPSIESASWTLVLQTALILGIWSSSSSAAVVGASGQGAGQGRCGDRLGKIVTMLSAFALGCVGSLAGSASGALFATRFASSEAERQTWAIAASCLSASYIGGTANFFETSIALGANKGPVAKTLNLIAGIDILMMVAYFGVLLALRAAVTTSKAGNPSSLFSFLKDSTNTNKQRDNEKDQQNNSKSASGGIGAAPPSADGPVRVAGTVALAVALAATAGQAQRLVPSIPGASVTASVLLALAVARLASAPSSSSSSSSFSSSSSPSPSSSSRPWSLLTGPAALAAANELAMAAFYACIGLGCRAQDAAAVGPVVLALMGLTLAVHLAVLLGGSWLYNAAAARLRLRLRLGSRGSGDSASDGSASGWTRAIDVDTAVIASNACVGGASTAASMAATLRGADPDLPWLGSLAGVVGYVIGTPLGLALARSLGVGVGGAL